MRTIKILLPLLIPVLSAQNQERIFEAFATADVAAALSVADVAISVSTTETLDKTLERLAPAGVTREHLVGSSNTTVNEAPPAPPPLGGGFSTFLLGREDGSVFQFLRTVPVAELAEFERTLMRIAGNQVALGNRLPDFRYSVNYRASSAELARAQEAAMPALFDEAVQVLRGLAAAAASEPGSITRAEFAPLFGNTAGLLLGSERTSPFTRRVVRVPVSERTRAALDQARIEIEVLTRRDVTREAVLQRMIQLGVSERNLTQMVAAAPSRPGTSSYLFTLTRTAADGETLANTIRQALRERPPGWESIRVSTNLVSSSKAKSAAREAALPGLLSVARAQAAILARLMNGQPGALRAASASNQQAFQQAFAIPQLIVGDFSFVAPAPTVSATFEFYVD